MKAVPTTQLPRGFTLIEIMVATAIMAILMVVLFQMTATMAEIWRSTAGKIGAFQGARAAFDSMSRSLGQATLMTYLDYVDGNNPPLPRSLSAGGNASNFTPVSYARNSELHFVAGPSIELLPGASATNTQGHAVFFQAPLGVVANTSNYRGLNELLNAVGFYIEFTDDSGSWPAFIQTFLGGQQRFRFRLMQWVQPSEEFSVYRATSATGYSRDWFRSSTAPFNGLPSIGTQSPAARMLAEDVIAVFFRPRLSPEDEDLLDGAPANSDTGAKLAPTYRYDSRSWVPQYAANGGSSTIVGSARFGTTGPLLVNLMRNQLPPLIDVAMIAIDPADGSKLAAANGNSMPGELRMPSGLFHERSGTSPQPAEFLFTNPNGGKSDLEQFEDQLSAAKINYRVFRSTLNLKGAKWSVD